MIDEMMSPSLASGIICIYILNYRTKVSRTPPTRESGLLSGSPYPGDCRGGSDPAFSLGTQT
jgi:hypothetical protein